MKRLLTKTVSLSRFSGSWRAGEYKRNRERKALRTIHYHKLSWRLFMIIALASPGIASTLDEGLDKIKRFLSEAAAQGAAIVKQYLDRHDSFRSGRIVDLGRAENKIDLLGEEVIVKQE